MLTKDKFKKYMDAVVDTIKFQEEIYKLCREYGDKTHDDVQIDVTPLMCSVVSLLEEIMKDESGWISYWTFELDRGERYVDGCVTWDDDSIIKLKTVDDLWNLLIENIKQKEGDRTNCDSISNSENEKCDFRTENTQLDNTEALLLPKTVNFKKLDESAYVPTRGSKSAAGYDLHALTGAQGMISIQAHETVKIKTGISVAIPEGYFGAIYARSGLATRQGLRPANCVGIIDSDYRGEIIVPLYNDSDIPQHIRFGERIAQLIISPYLPVEFKEVDDLDETERGDGGFGSTGTR